MKVLLHRAGLYVRAFLGLHNIHDGSTCEVSAELWDVHDYPKNKGGDGFPGMGEIYQCPKCGKKFGI